ncbi:stability determinant [Amphibiibacter pelophylacis]|uniref:Stability determinant n=1 Tax=Amphibiibacter pelophylacis TaxID=1799477 RepID=A0ACC6NZC6_9BURK
MPPSLSPLVSEFESTDQEASYTAWLQRKTAASLADARPPVEHGAVMAELDALIDHIETEPPQS